MVSRARARDARGMRRAITATAVAAMLSSGCSFLLVEGPGSNYQPTRAPVCTESAHKPMLIDGTIALFTAIIFGAVTAGYIQENPAMPGSERDVPAALGVGTAGTLLTVAFVYSAVWGKKQSARCRAAWADFATNAE